MKTPPQLILENPELLNNLRTLFGEYVDENSLPVKGKEKELEKLLDKLHRVGIDKKLTLKQKGIELEQWYEYLQQNTQTTTTEAPRYEAPTQSNIPQKGLREVQEAERAAQEAALAAAKEKGIAQTEEFIESQLKRVKAIKVDPKEEIPEIALSQDDKEKLHDMGVAAKTDAGTAQKIVEEKIQEALSKSTEEIREAVPKEIITKAAVDFVDKVKPFGDYKTAEEIPDKIQTIHPAAPIAAVAIVNDAKLKGLITDEQARKILAENAQSIALAIEIERNVNLSLTNSFLYESPNVTSVLYGPEQITQFEIADDQTEKNDEGIDIDIGEIIDRGKDIRDVWEKIATGRITVAETAEATTSFVSSYTPSVNLAISSQASSLLVKALPITGALAGFKGSLLATQWIRQGMPLLTSPSIAGLLTRGGAQQLVQTSTLVSWKGLGFISSSGRFSMAIATGKTVGQSSVLAAGLKFGQHGIAIAATSTGTKVALSGVFAKIGAFLGSVGPVVGTLIGAAVGWLFGKIAEKIPWKKVLPVLAGIAGFFLFGPLIGLGLGLGTAALIGVGSGVRVGMTLAGIGTGFVGFFRALGSAMVISIGTPILVTLLVFPVVVALILFIINSGAYLVPPSIVGQKQSQNPYIDVQKVPNPPGPFQNSDLPITVTYTITVTAKKGTLTNIKYNNVCKVIQQGSQNPCPAETPEEPQSISPSSPFVFTYEEIYDGTNYIDSLVLDTFTVTADADQEKGITTSGSASITIGNPPTDCLAVEGTWPSDYLDNINQAMGTLISNHSNYVSKVCLSYDKISLRYNPSGYGNYWGWNHVLYIDFYALGVGNYDNALYTLSHELGHSLIRGAQTAYIFAEYLRYPGITTEKPLCFYSDAAGVPDEELPESIAFYIIPTRSCSLTGDTSDIQNWPIHLQFLKKYVFN